MLFLASNSVQAKDWLIENLALKQIANIEVEA